MSPFLTIVTSTHRRPTGLARLMASVERQTAVDAIEHVIVPDYVGLGIVHALYGRLPHYASAVHGQYVQLLGDDDVLVRDDAVEQIQAFAEARDYPPVLLVTVQKGAWRVPVHPVWPPVCGRIDLGCLIVRADVWRAHLSNYGDRYEGDYDFAAALAGGGYQAHWLDVVCVAGAVGRGRVECVA